MEQHVDASGSGPIILYLDPATRHDSAELRCKCRSSDKGPDAPQAHKELVSSDLTHLAVAGTAIYFVVRQTRGGICQTRGQHVELGTAVLYSTVHGGVRD